MSQAAPTKEDIFDSIAPLLLETAPEEDFLAKDVLQETIMDLRQRFESDFQTFSAQSGLVFSKDISGYGDKSTNLFQKWSDGEDVVTLPAMLAHAVDFFEMEPNTPLVNALYAAAILAEVPNAMQYHGNEHYRKVVFHTIRLISKHNEIHANDHLLLSKDEIAKLLIAACIHDLGHQGGDNLRDGFYTPGAMEQHSFDMAKPFLLSVELNDDQLDVIETLVFCTDITFFAGENSPCVRMKQIFKYYIWGDEKKEVGMMMVGKLRLFYDDPKLVSMAMILHESDVGSSAGLSYRQTIQETINFMEERGVKTAGPNVVLAFLRDQLGETMFTEAGKQIFGPVMAEVIEKAEEDIKANRESFYE